MIEITKIFRNFAIDCNRDGGFLGFPSWHSRLDKVEDASGQSCTVVLQSLSDIWKIAISVTEILLRLAIYIAIFFIIYGGVQFVISQGSPDKVAAAKSTIANAVIGLVVSITATAIVAYVAGLL